MMQKIHIQFLRRRIQLNSKGIALIMATTTLSLIIFLVIEMTYETNVEFLVHGQAVNRLKAYYAARAGVELGLLRIKLYKQLNSQFGDTLGSMRSQLNQIWQFPFDWPPMLPPGMDGVEKNLIEAKIKESKMDGSFRVMISDEGSKQDVNDLGSRSKAIREGARRYLLNIFQNKIRDEPKWFEEHPGFKAEELINNISDWIDNDTESQNGGQQESVLYPIRPTTGNFPPNRAFRTLAELRFVAGMTDDIYKLIEPRLTTYGMRSINPNFATREVLLALDPAMSDLVVEEILKRRQNPELGGPFKDAKEFWAFVQPLLRTQLGADTEKSVQLSFEGVTNFKVVSTGTYGEISREITVIVFDLDQAASITGKALQAEKAEAQNQQGTKTTGTGKTSTSDAKSKTKPPLAKGVPRIVFWSER